MKHLTVQFSPTSCHFISLRSKYSPEHHQSTFLARRRHQVSHPYRTTGKIIVLYFLIFTFSDSRREVHYIIRACLKQPREKKYSVLIGLCSWTRIVL
jgi:hypothetical protein